MDEEKIESLRKSLGDTEEEKLFTDEEIERELQKTNNEYLCLYRLYIQKAGRLLTNETYIKSIKAGNEEIARLNAQDLQAIALKQALSYKELYEQEKEAEEMSHFVY